MKNNRVLPILNAVGCLALTVLVVVQWQREHETGRVVDRLRNEIAAAHARAAEDARHRAALERDISVLKEAIESIQRAAEESALELEEQQQLNASLQAEVAATGDQLAAWEAAVKQRDQRITTLNEELERTRQRLEEAVARLREAGAR